jgi:hypothetical protein
MLPKCWLSPLYRAASERFPYPMLMATKLDEPLETGATPRMDAPS